MNEEYIFKKLSEMYGVSEELIEMIDPIFGDDLGSSRDRVHYGYYCEFPELSELSEDVKDEIFKEEANLKIPFGETEYFSLSTFSEDYNNQVEKDCKNISLTDKINQQSILNGKKDKMYGILLCLYSGLRIGELIALQWSDIDFVKGILTVSKSCHDGQDGLIIDEPKTANSRRLIPLPKQLLPILKGIKKKSKSPFVVSANGSSVSVRSYQRSFELLLKRLNIPHKGFHSLRHTFATRALECGMDIKTLAEILGHKNPTVTLNRYAHSLMEHKSDMMNRLGKLL
ncbi:MAG: site-specific integrase [Bacilli bacterium]